MPGRRDLELERRHERRWDPQRARRAGDHVAAQQAGRGLRPEDRHRPGVRHRGRDRAEADPLDDAEAAAQLDDRRTERLPAVVGFGSDQDQHVASPSRTWRTTSSCQVSSVSRPSTISSGGRRAR